MKARRLGVRPPRCAMEWAIFATLTCHAMFQGSRAEAQDVDSPTPGLEVGVEEQGDGGEAPGSLTLELAYTGVLFPLADRVRAQALVAYNSSFDILLGVGDISADVHENVDLGVTYILLARFDGAEEHTFRLYQNLVFRSGPFKLDARNAIDYRPATASVEERTRFRSRIRSTYNGEVSGIKYSLYVSVEPIYNFNEDEIRQVSFAVGGYVHLVADLWLNAFYQRTETKTGPDIDFPGAGLLVIL